MTDTLQPLPSWMTYSSEIYTQPNGVLATSYSILQLPLTYYGPSIPLGPDWVYGGLSSPAPTTAPATTAPTTTASTTTPPTTSAPTNSATPTTISSTSAIPSSTSLTSVIPTTSASSTITATPSSITSSPLTSSTTSSTPASSMSSAAGTAPTAVSPPSHGLSHNSIVAIICGSIAGFLILLVLLVLCCVLVRRNRRRRGEHTPFAAPQPAFFMRGVPVSLSSMGSSYILIDAERSGRRAGEGSPRHSGDEADPFLQASAARRRAFADDRSRSSSGSTPAKASVWAIGPDGQRIHIRNSDGSEAEHGAESEPEHDTYTDMDTTVVDDEAGRFRAFVSADQERVKVAAARQLLSPGAAAAYAAAGQDPTTMHKKAAAHDVDLNEKMPVTPAQSYGGSDALGLSLLGLPDVHSSATHLTPSRSGTPYRNAPRLSNDSGVSLADRYSPATFMFAHRVQVADPRVPPAGSPPELRSALLGEPSRTPEPESAVTTHSQHWLSPLTNNLNSLGLGALGWLRREPSALGRPLEGTWLARVPTPSRSNRSQRSRETSGSDDEETGLLADLPPAAPSGTARSRGQVSVPSSADRPVSSVSHRSNASTVYHTAAESLLGDRASSAASAPLAIPAMPAAVARPGRESPLAHATTMPGDLLDLPIPAAVPSFANSSGRRRAPPPRLQLAPSGIPTPRVWTDARTSSPEHTPLSPIASVSDASADLLDAAPPRAVDVWRSLADARERGVRAPGAVPTVVHPTARRESYNVSVHGSSLSGSSGRGSLAWPQPHGLAARGSTAPLLPRPRDSTLSHQSSGGSLAPRSSVSGASSPSSASWQDRGFEGAASLTAFGPPQPGVFMSRNPYAPLTRPSGLASGSTIRVVQPTPAGSEESA